MTAILGISAFYHDSGAALLIDGEIVAAAQEERFTRKKHDAGYPKCAIAYVLDQAGIDASSLDHVVFYDKPFLKFERLLETYLAFVPRGFKQYSMAMPIWLREKLFLKTQLVKEMKKLDSQFDETKLLFNEHHLSHAASAFYPSPFEEAIVLTMDGVGEWATTTVCIGKGRNLEMVKEIKFPDSIGLLYSAFTYYTGFKVNSGEYKVMGLAPYGKPRFTQLILDNLVDVKADGSFRLDQSYFGYATGLKMVSKKFVKLFGEPVRVPEKDPLTQFHMDIAASVQAVTEMIVLRITSTLRDEYSIPNLCLAGGVALNCVANGKIIEGGKFDGVWVQPAAGDAGGALGAALSVWHRELEMSRKPTETDCMKGSYLGPMFTDDEIMRSLDNCGAIYELVNEETMIKETAIAISRGMAVGWFQGRMEFGPRALGGRSILGDPRSPSMQKNLNLKVKFRESFRPFAPSVLADKAKDWFELEGDSPYMLIVAAVKKERRIDTSDSDDALFGIDKLNLVRSDVPAITHIDYSARVQTVHQSTNPKYHALLKKHYDLTGCPLVVNTSFNVRGEPIVCFPEDAFKCFMGTGLDFLAIGNCLLRKELQDTALLEDYSNKYELD